MTPELPGSDHDPSRDPSDDSSRGPAPNVEELPKAWREPRVDSPSPDSPSTGDRMLGGCGSAALIVIAIFGLLFGTCLLSMR